LKSSTLTRAEGLAIWLGIIGNALLFGGKIVIGLWFHSISIISDSLNSFTDIIASLVVYISIRTSYQAADSQHPYGHKRAQPIAGLIVAIFTGIVGFEVIAQAVNRLLTRDRMQPGLLPILLVLGVLVIKLFMHLYVQAVARRTGSTALLASAADHRNDVLVSAAVLIGVLFSNFGFPVFDPIVAILIGLWIIKAGFNIGRDNIKYLMGEAPPATLLESIQDAVRAIHGVERVHDVRAHYVGTMIHIEVHINVNQELNVEQAHAIGKQVQAVIESRDGVARAFIHIDPLAVA
jgi:cation diffusion facilitator family transporter